MNNLLSLGANLHRVGIIRHKAGDDLQFRREGVAAITYVSAQTSELATFFWRFATRAGQSAQRQILRTIEPFRRSVARAIARSKSLSDTNPLARVLFTGAGFF